MTFFGDVNTANDDEEGEELNPRDGFMKEEEGERNSKNWLEISEERCFGSLDVFLTKKIEGETNDGAKKSHIENGEGGPGKGGEKRKEAGERRNWLKEEIENKEGKKTNPETDMRGEPFV